MQEVKEQTARNRILSRLRQSANEPIAFEESYERMQGVEWNDADRVTEFCLQLEKSHAEVHRVPANDWVATVKKILVEKQVRSALLPPGTPLGIELKNALVADMSIVHYPDSYAEFKPQLFDDINAAVTGARWGIAETGTLVLWPDAEEPRTMSLVPPLHVVVLDAKQIVNTLFSLMTDENWAEQGMPSNALLISGPSKTADIQQTLAYGAHGPCELVAIVRE